MKYDLLFKIEAERDLGRMSPDVARRVLRKIERMRNGLAGEVKTACALRPRFAAAGR